VKYANRSEVGLRVVDVAKTVASVFCVVLFFGCASGERDTPPPLIYCDSLCAAVVACHGNADNCLTPCIDGSQGLTKSSVQGTRLVGDCVRRLPCADLFDTPNWPETVNGCVLEAHARIEPSARALELCEDFSLTTFECGGSFSVDLCAHRFSMWADWVLDEVQACSPDPSCAELFSCVEGAFSSP